MTIVVADDNTVFCEAFKAYTDSTDYVKVIGIAHDGVTAVEQIEDLSPDVVLLDNIMPRLDGIGVMDKIAHMKLKKRPKIVAMSAFINDDFLVNALKLGANYVIARDIGVEEIAKRIKMIGSQSSPAVNSADGGTYSSDDFQIVVTKLLHKLGIPANLKGYEYIRKAVEIVKKDKSAINAVTKMVYPEIASLYNTDSCNVERAIRHAINTAWKRGNETELHSLFGAFIDKNKTKPTNSEFIATLSEYILIRYKEI